MTLIVNGVLDHTNSRLPENKLTREKLVASADQQKVDIHLVTEVVISAAFWSIGRECFKDLQLLENVVCPDTLLFIEEKAFSWCLGLKTINIPKNVESIGERAFEHCRHLQKVNIPNIEVIEAKTFDWCLLLTEISIPVTVKHIKEGAFESCVKLAKINFSETGIIKKISDSAFRGCAFKELVLYDGVEEIGEDAFSGCQNLETAKIPDTVKIIKDSAFFYCAFKTLTIPNSVHTIGASAFAENLSLKTVTLPNNLQKISVSLFEKCASLETAIIPNSVQEICRTAFENCPKLHTIAKRIRTETGYKYGPSFGSLVSIGEGAFWGCSSLVEIPIMHSLVTIHYKAFYKCTNLVAVTLGSKLEEIYAGAFRKCPNLLVVLVPYSISYIGEGAFQDCPNLWVIAPYESREKFNKYMSLPTPLLPLEHGPPEPFEIQQYLPFAEGRSDAEKSAIRTYMENVKGHSLMVKQYIVSYNKAQISGGPKADDTVNEAAKLALRVQYCTIATHTQQSSLTQKQLEWVRTVYLIFKRNELASFGEFATHQSEDTLEVQTSTPPEIVQLILSWIAMQLIGPVDTTVQPTGGGGPAITSEAQMVAPRTFNDNVHCNRIFPLEKLNKFFSIFHK